MTPSQPAQPLTPPVKRKGIPFPPPLGLAVSDIAGIGYQCPGSKQKFMLQVNLGQAAPLQPGSLAYPLDNDTFKCPKCGVENNLLPIRLQIEAQSGRKAVK